MLFWLPQRLPPQATLLSPQFDFIKPNQGAITMSNAISVIPSNLQLPAHLQSPDVAAAIAAANAAAAGGVRAGGFPSISIKANKFHIKDGDETVTLMNAPTHPGAPALPMMCLEVVVVDANPSLSHTFFEGEYVEGEHAEPVCRSANGVTPDADVAAPQSLVCATCPQYAWGSAVSKLTGKPIRACNDSKQLAVVPANDLNYKMLGLQVKAGSLKNWGTYIQALTGRGYGISTLVTNITFDQTANGVLQFSFNRFLTEAEFAKVNERKNGDDVKRIVAQSRALAPAPALAAPSTPPAPPAVVAPVEAPVQTSGFGAAPAPIPAPAPVVAPAAAPATAAPISPTAESPFAGLEPHVQAAVDAAGGLNSHAGMRTYQALTGVDYMALVSARATAPTPAAAPVAAPAPTPAPAAPAEPPKRTRRTRAEIEAAANPTPTPAPAGDLSHIPADIMATINAVGASSPAGQALIAAYPAPQAAAPAPAPAAPPPPPAAAPTTGFGAAPAAPVQTEPTAQVVASGASLAEKLRAKLGMPGAV
jgi:hypothetical protein